MSRNITKIETLPKLEKLKKVVAYARVSNGKDAMQLLQRFNPKS